MTSIEYPIKAPKAILKVYQGRLPLSLPIKPTYLAKWIRYKDHIRHYDISIEVRDLVGRACGEVMALRSRTNPVLEGRCHLFIHAIDFSIQEVDSRTFKLLLDTAANLSDLYNPILIELERRPQTELTAWALIYYRNRVIFEVCCLFGLERIAQSLFASECRDAYNYLKEHLNEL